MARAKINGKEYMQVGKEGLRNLKNFKLLLVVSILLLVLTCLTRKYYRDNDHRDCHSSDELQVDSENFIQVT